MHSLTPEFLERLRFNATHVGTLRALGEYRGKQELFFRQMVLGVFRRVFLGGMLCTRVQLLRVFIVTVFLLLGLFLLGAKQALDA